MSNKALMELITAKKAMERELNQNLKELNKWEARIESADCNDKIELGNKALDRRNFYANLVSEIQQHIEQVERQINTAKEKISTQSTAFERMERKVLEIQQEGNTNRKKEPVQDSPWELPPNLEPEFDNRYLLSFQSLSEAINEVNKNIEQAERQHKIINSQYSEYEKKAESFHYQALEFMKKGETNAATIALSSEATTKNLLDSLKIQIDNQIALIDLLNKHLKVLRRLINPQVFDVDDDSIIDAELEMLRKKLNELQMEFYKNLSP